ncbi:MAG: hypothetical protein Q8830_03885, partial [Candidatus Phytoplasma australasiaticum]|nr:hypothetical protein [Candidatus Phytoplasma australasiaticum]
RDVTFHEHEFPFAEAFARDAAPLSLPVTVGFDDDIAATQAPAAQSTAEPATSSEGDTGSAACRHY